ncbi:hypothetical protein LVJ83_13100 [Uruburuella testudinis]|uniref:Regulatory protein, RpfE type n=1 Tax=Uruburuella testudinis TaxID=1282863 RepID=A0ABY4DT11_9NEIS|nr:hypothetical protein [Uruburuella testudinis]UOO81825.1 hypothetical protein LVJ83_13100 [Uruburuella testudinis]
MNLTLALPGLNHSDGTPLPLPDLPAFNQMLRFGTLIRKPLPASAFLARYLWRGSLLASAKQQLGMPAERAAVLASPVWQQMGMNHMDMLGGADIGIGLDEAEQWCRGLSSFYREEGWCFEALRADLWLVGLPAAPDWQVPPLPDVLGRADGSVRAQGRDSREWLQKQTEIQMWLHSHPLNHSRTAAGVPAVNGVWLWQDLEGGQTEAPLLACDSPWAQFYPGKRCDAPYDFAAWQHLAAEAGVVSDGLIWLDDLQACAHTGDTGAYVQTLQDWETRWFAPLWQALKSGRLNRLKVVTDGDNGGELCLKAKAGRAFWKPKRRFAGQMTG